MRLHFTAAFELDADGSFLDAIRSSGATAGLGHTDADYGTAMKLAENGVRSFTHLFNAMSTTVRAERQRRGCFPMRIQSLSATAFMSRPR